MSEEIKTGPKIVIVANGEIRDPERDSAHLDGADLVIAADGGALHCRRLGVVPDLLVGDFDSMDSALLAEMAADGIPIQRHPARKDQTDLELALAEALDRGARDIVILGGLGGRWDMTLSTVFGLAAPHLSGIRVRLVDAATEIELLRGKTRHIVHGRPGDTLSLLPLGADATGVTLRGLEYPLTDATIPGAAALGVSNVFTGSRADVTIQAGLLLCVHRSTR